MIKTRVSIADIIRLHEELQLLLFENLPVELKYRLNHLFGIIEHEKMKADKQSEMLIEKLGSADENGEITLEAFTDIPGSTAKTVHPVYKSFHEQFSALMAGEVEIVHYPFSLRDLDSFSSQHHYPVFFNLIS